MLVALYQDHHQLPWWGGKTNPFDVFNPERHKSLPFKGGRIVKEVDGHEVVGNSGTIPLEDVKQLFSFLSGLHNVEASHLMAHVSAMCGCEMEKKGWWHYPKRVWVQISTLPNEYTEAGVPVVYDMIGERKPELNHLWGGDNGTGFPSQFFVDERLREMAANDSRIWTRFFVEQLDLDPKLKSAKADFHAAEQRLKEAKKAVEALQTFGPDKLNTKLNVTFTSC
jgi:hypothetical protein